MKSNTKKTQKNSTIALVKNDFFGPLYLRHWLRLLWVFLKYIIFSFLLISGCLGLLAFLILGLIPDSVIIKLSYLNLGEVAMLIQTTMYKVIFPSSVIFSVISTVERYQKTLDN